MRVHASNEKLGYHIQGDLRMVFDTDSAPGIVIGRIPALGLVVEGRTQQEAQEKLQQIFAEFCDVASEQQGKSILDALVARGCKITPMSGDQAGPRHAAQYLEIFFRSNDAEPKNEPKDAKRALAEMPSDEQLAAAGR